MVKNSDEKKITRPETAGRLIRRRRDCPRFHECKARLCPIDPKIAYQPIRKNEPVCLFEKEAYKAGKTNRCDPKKTPGQSQAENVREISRFVRRTYYQDSKDLLRKHMTFLDPKR